MIQLIKQHLVMFLANMPSRTLQPLYARLHSLPGQVSCSFQYVGRPWVLHGFHYDKLPFSNLIGFKLEPFIGS